MLRRRRGWGEGGEEGAKAARPPRREVDELGAVMVVEGMESGAEEGEGVAVVGVEAAKEA